MAPKPIVFRVQGIPPGLDGDAVLSSLSAALLACGDVTKEQLRGIRAVDIVPSCVAEDRQCALLKWQGDGDCFLSHLSTDAHETHQVEVGGDDWTLDRHFFGFTQLYIPAIDHAVIAECVLSQMMDFCVAYVRQRHCNYRSWWPCIWLVCGQRQPPPHVATRLLVERSAALPDNGIWLRFQVVNSRYRHDHGLWAWLLGRTQEGPANIGSMPGALTSSGCMPLTHSLGIGKEAAAILYRT